MNDEVIAVGGWMVKVIKPNPIGGQPMQQWFAVGTVKKPDAEARAREYLHRSDITIDARRRLTATEIKTIRLRLYEVRAYE